MLSSTPLCRLAHSCVDSHWLLWWPGHWWPPHHCPGTPPSSPLSCTLLPPETHTCGSWGKSRSHLSEDDMLAIQPGGQLDCDEELAAVGVLPWVGHGQQPLLTVLHHKVLVGELGSIDGLAPPAIALGEVAALWAGRRMATWQKSHLEHEVWDDPVELWACVAKPLLPGA